MTIKFNNVYINNTSTVAGPYLNSGPLKGSFDMEYNDFYDNEKTFEDCEIKEAKKALDILLRKENIDSENIDVILSGDLSNQIMISNEIVKDYGIPYLGIYSACASFTEELIIAAFMLNNKCINKIVCMNTSHNLTSERQFRSPIEYGAPKPDYSTFTVSAASSCLLSNAKSNIKVESGTIGKVVDLGIKDSFDMGSAMAPAAADTLNNHLISLNREANYYDLILTGDLGKYGKKIFKEYMKQNYNIKLKNYNDTATLIYNKDDKDTLAGGSGPVCMPIYVFSKIIPEMKKGKIKKVLLLATGALLSQTSVNQKKTIPCICHAVSLEVV